MKSNTISENKLYNTPIPFALSVGVLSLSKEAEVEGWQILHPSTSLPFRDLRSGRTERGGSQRYRKALGYRLVKYGIWYKAWVIFILLSTSLYASPSLFFTKEEIHLIHSANKKTEKNAETLHLSAIIYVNKDHWSLWLNNEVIRSDQLLSIDGFHIEHVTAHRVTFSWNPPNSSVPLRFILRPNQTFLLNQKRVEPQ